ncbi:MAG: restriction endonuclease subunit S [Proteobacteria bacterium]|nr:restriction endonuclease subunit S [Pseudomonadota bacterium]
MGDSRYEELPLGEIADFRNGKGLSPDKYTAVGKYPVFGSNGQIARTDELLNEDSVVVIGRVGAYCGSVHPVFEPSWVTDNAIVARPKAGEDVRYLYYRLASLDLRSTATGSAQPLVTQSGLGVLRAPHAPPDDQRAIAHILGTLDDKIELNRRMNETLEAMARALFKSWFVDFDPVRAKAQGQTPPAWTPPPPPSSPKSSRIPSWARFRRGGVWCPSWSLQTCYPAELRKRQSLTIGTAASSGHLPKMSRSADRSSS